VVSVVLPTAGGPMTANARSIENGNFVIAGILLRAC
jgi:hypothetical protein